MKSYTFDVALQNGLINGARQKVTLLIRIADLIKLGIGARRGREHPHSLRIMSAILFKKDGALAVEIDKTATILQSRKDHLLVLVKGTFNAAVDYDASQFPIDKQGNVAVILPKGEVIRVWRHDGKYALLANNAISHEIEIRSY